MPILNLQRQSIGWLLTEFIVVVLGVAVALAADSWREDFSERGLERDYLARIKSELEIGNDQLEAIHLRFSTAYESADFLVGQLENINNIVDDSLLVEHFTKSTWTGGPSGGISHSAVYSELLSTGRLNLISNPDLRIALLNYYRDLEINSQELGTLPRIPWERYRELTGNEAGYYINTDRFPVGETADRLIAELRSGDLSVRQFRLLRTRLNLLSIRLERLIEDNLSLVELIDSEII